MNSKEQTVTTLRSLEEVVAALSEGERTKYKDILYSMNLSLEAFEPYCSWSEESYMRNCIFENKDFELILLCWEKNQITPIHNHGGEECWVKVLEGEFRECIYQEDQDGKLQKIKSVISKAEDISYMIDFMGFHSLENLSAKRSMSLHLYAKPIRNCMIFDEDSREFVNRKLTYDTVSQ